MKFIIDFFKQKSLSWMKHIDQFNLYQIYQKHKKKWTTVSFLASKNTTLTVQRSCYYITVVELNKIDYKAFNR